MWAIGIAVVVMWIVGVVDIVRGPLARQTQAAWLLIVVLLPIVGTIAYFLIRRPTAAEIAEARQRTGHGYDSRKDQNFRPM
jgi:hypothetical protein